MTIADAKQELKSYKHNLEYIKAKQQDIKEFRTRLESTVKPPTDMPGGGGDPKRFENDMAKLIDLQNEHSAFWLETERLRINIERKISNLQQPYKNILYMRYINWWSLEKIALVMSYSCKHVYRIHGTALYEYSKRC